MPSFQVASCFNKHKWTKRTSDAESSESSICVMRSPFKEGISAIASKDLQWLSTIIAVKDFKRRIQINVTSVHSFVGVDYENFSQRNNTFQMYVAIRYIVTKSFRNRTNENG